MKGGGGIRLDLLMALIALIISPVVSDLLISKIDRKIDLRSQIVRMTSTLKVENTGSDPVSDVLVAFPDHQAKNIALFVGSTSEVKGKTESSTKKLSIKVVQPGGMPPALTWYSLTLPKDLGKGESVTLDLKTVFTHILKPFPVKITQAENQLVVFQDSAYFISPYVVKVQSLSFKLPETKIESYTKLENTKVSGTEIKYGPYENVPALQYSPLVIHFVCNRPFPVAQELVREIEISHWGNVQITEHYNLVHGGAQSTGEFSRLDYQARGKGAAAFRNLEAQLPLRAHSIYYRDEIGNISTSNFLPDSKKTVLEIEPRYPMFGGWKTSFTIGYGLPLQDYLFQSDGKRFLNISFGCPMNDVLVEKLIVKVVLPEGSKDISVSTLFPVEQLEEIKFSHLDIVGRPVVVLQKENVIPEYNQPFQVYYNFSNFSLLREPLMLISGFFFLFLACIVYMHADLTISKSSPSYLAKLQWDEVRATIQLVLNIIHQSLAIHDKLEGSLRDLSRTGDVQACKASRKAADSALKELSKELRPLLAFLQSLAQASHVVPKVEELIAKERELQEKLMAKHSTVVDSYEKKSGGRDIENRIVAIQHKISVLRQEVDELVEFIDEI